MLHLVGYILEYKTIEISSYSYGSTLTRMKVITLSIYYTTLTKKNSI